MKKLLYLIPGLLLFAACGSPEEEVKENVEKKELKAEPTNCTYAFNAQETTVLWEAYKFTERAAVGGKMDSVLVTGSLASSAPKSVLTGAEFVVYTDAVNSNNADRDMKIRKHFFGALQMPKKITGTIKSIDENDKAVIALNFNGVTQDLEMDYSFSEGKRIKLEGTLDVSNFEASKAVEALNEVCKELHTGTDGESKLWPDFKLTVISDLTKDCE